MFRKKELRAITRRVSQELNLPEEVVYMAWKSVWEFTIKTIGEMPFEEMQSQEDFKKHRTSVNIPGLGKFYSTWERVGALRTQARMRVEMIKKKINARKENQSKEDQTSLY